MKAILTTFHSQTETKPARIVAMDCDGNRCTVKESEVGDSALSDEAAHKIAAQALCTKMGWSGELVGGWTGNGYSWVFLRDKAPCPRCGGTNSAGCPVCDGEKEMYSKDVGGGAKLSCPVCGGADVVYCVDWEAKSTDDSDNTATLPEYQCRNEKCGISFWVETTEK